MPEQYSNLIIATRNGSPVYLRDVATAEDTIQDERITMHFWDRMHVVPTATVVLAVFRQAGTNAVVVAQSVRDLVPGRFSAIAGVHRTVSPSTTDRNRSWIRQTTCNSRCSSHSCWW